MTNFRLLCVLALLPAACAVEDSRVATDAPAPPDGHSEVDLESCLGAPDQHSTFGNTDILTYYATSTSTITWSVPVVGGMGFVNGGYCHATFTVTSGRVTRILYSGEKNAIGAPNAFCAPILRTCIEDLRRADRSASPPARTDTAPPTPSTP